MRIGNNNHAPKFGSSVRMVTINTFSPIIHELSRSGQILHNSSRHIFEGKRGMATCICENPVGAITNGLHVIFFNMLDKDFGNIARDVVYKINNRIGENTTKLRGFIFGGMEGNAESISQQGKIKEFFKSKGIDYSEITGLKNPNNRLSALYSTDGDVWQISMQQMNNGTHPILPEKIGNEVENFRIDKGDVFEHTVKNPETDAISKAVA